MNKKVHSCSELLPLLCIIIATATNSAESVLYPTSRSAAAVVNTSVTFSCTTTTLRQLRWRRYTPASIIPVLIYNGITLPDPDSPYHLTHHPQTGQSDLTIRNVQLEHAGRFECLEMSTALQAFSFQLVVLEIEPVCSSNVSADQRVLQFHTIAIDCRVQYSGDPEPVVHCVPGTKSYRRVETQSADNSTVLSVTHGTVVVATPSLDNLAVSCTTSFELATPQHAVVDKTRANLSVHLEMFNVTFSWVSPPLRVIGLYSEVVAEENIESEDSLMDKKTLVIATLSVLGGAVISVLFIVIISFYRSFNKRRRTTELPLDEAMAEGPRQNARSRQGTTGTSGFPGDSRRVEDGGPPSDDDEYQRTSEYLEIASVDVKTDYDYIEATVPVHPLVQSTELSEYSQLVDTVPDFSDSAIYSTLIQDYENVETE